MSILPQHSKWQQDEREAGTEWHCPEGIYEVYVSLAETEYLQLNGKIQAYVVGSAIGMWLPGTFYAPASLSGTIVGTRTTTGTRTTAAHNIVTQAPPGTDVEAAASQTGTLTETGTLAVDLSGSIVGAVDVLLSTNSQGWTLTTGDILFSIVAYSIRFRRIG